jgi:ABC-2 type transport system permease protein
MHAFRQLVLTELRLFLREPVNAFFTLGFPPLLVLILGSIPAFREPSPDLGGARVIDLYLPITIGYVIAAIGLSGLPAVLGSYREKGILRRLATTPVPPSRLLGAQVVLGLAMLGTGVVSVLGVGRLVYGAALPASPVAFALALLLGAGAAFALGLLVAAVAPSAAAASAIGMTLFFPMLFFGGMWVPREAMPELLRRISDFTPLGAAVQSLRDATAGGWPDPLHLAVLAAFALGAGVAAAKLFRWE